MTSGNWTAAIKGTGRGFCAAAAQAQADQKAADEAREKMAADMRLANERIAGLSAEVDLYPAQMKIRFEQVVKV